MIKKIVLGFVILVLVGAAISNLGRYKDENRPGILPSSSIYFLKSWPESLQSQIIAGNKPLVQRHMELASRRLYETKALAEKQKWDFVPLALIKYEDEMELAEKYAIITSGEELYKAEFTIALAVLKKEHQPILLNIKQFENKYNGNLEDTNGLTESKLRNWINNTLNIKK